MNMKEKVAWSAAGAVVAVMGILLSQMGETPEPAVRLNNMNKAQRDSVVAKETREAKVGDEIVTLRKLNTRIHKIGNNQFRATISSKPMNYLDDTDGLYKPVDMTVKDVHELAKDDPLRKFDKYINNGNWRAGWYKEKPHDVSLYRETSFISYTALFDTLDVPVKTEYQTDGVKQTYTFTDVESVQDLKWLMSSNTVKQKQFDGSITFYDSTYTPIFTSPAPTAWDANHVNVPVTVTISGDTLIYVASIPEGAVFPIIIDPSTLMVNYTSGASGIMYYAAKSYAGARDSTDYKQTDTSVGIGQSLSGTDYYADRTHLYFDTSGLPDGVNVLSGVLNFGRVQFDSDTTPFYIHVIQATTTGTTITSSWFNDFTGWVAGAKWTTTPLADSVVSSAYAVGDSIKMNLNAAGCLAVSTTSATRFIVISTRLLNQITPTGSEFLQTYVADVKYLQITYSDPPTAPTNFANTAKTTTTLSYSWTDNSSDELGFKIKNAGGDTVTVASSAAGAVADTVEGLGVNTRHGLRVFAYSADGWSTPSDSVVTYTLAAAPTSWNFTNIGASGTVDVGFNVNGNPATTQFAVRDSTEQTWVQTDGTTGSTIEWATYATWNAVAITEPGTTGTRRYSVMARNGDNVNTAEITGTLYVYKFSEYPPTGFAMTVLSTTSIQADWTNALAGYDSLLIMNDPEHTAVMYTALATLETATTTGLSVNTLYTFFVRADSAGLKADSNSDLLYTLANPATVWAFTETAPLVITPAFNGNGNPAATTYALRDSLRHVWISATGVPSGTKIWRTEAQWEAITLTGLIYDQQYLIGVVGKNGNDVETTYLWGSVTTASLSTTVTAINDGSLVSIPQTTNYALFTPNSPIYDRVDSSSYAVRDYTFAEEALPGLVVGQRYYNSVYYNYRGFLTFDTSTIPDDAVIDSVKVKFKLTAKNSISDFDYLYLAKSLGFTGAQTNYWHLFTGWASSGTYTITQLASPENIFLLTNGDSTNIYYKLNADGLAAVSKTGNTEFVLITENDRVNVAPTTVECVTLDGTYVYMQVYYNAYAYSRDVATGGVIDTLKVGQDSLSVNRYAIDRSFLSFPLPTGMTAATSAVLFLNGYADSSNTDFGVYLLGANAYRPTLTTADFINFNGRQGFLTPHTGVVLNSTWNSSSYVSGWNEIPLDTDGLDSLAAAAEDTLYLALISKEDYDASAPTTGGVASNQHENLMFHSSSQADSAPYLDLTYTTTIPSDFTLTPTLSSQITATWNDNSGDETGFRIIDSVTYDYIDSVAAGVETINLAGLGVNTAHSYRVQVKGGASDYFASAPESTWTLANVPAVMTLSLIGSTGVKFVLGVNSNPSYTKFAVQDSVTGKFVYSLAGPCSLGTAIQWHTYAQFGGASGDTLTVLPGQYVVLRAAARNTNQ